MSKRKSRKSRRKPRTPSSKSGGARQPNRAAPEVDAEARAESFSELERAFFARADELWAADEPAEHFSDLDVGIAPRRSGVVQRLASFLSRAFAILTPAPER